jgi:hypothetical protein
LGEEVQRRGTHVSVPEIGSRDGQLNFGGIWESYADLRREIKGGDFNLGVFCVLGVGPRKCVEEGGPFSVICVFGELTYCGWGDLKGVRGGVFSQERTSGASCLVPGRHRGSA